MEILNNLQACTQQQNCGIMYWTMKMVKNIHITTSALSLLVINKYLS